MMTEPWINIIKEIHGEFSAIPVPVKEIAYSHGILIQNKLTLGESAGNIAYYNDKCVIQVNSFDSYQRQRFTIAHELGHFFLHQDKIPRNKRDYPQEESRFNFNTLSANKMYRSGLPLDREVEANKFAAELLMPINILEDLITKKGIRKIVDLAEILKVSTQALSIRLGIPTL